MSQHPSTRFASGRGKRWAASAGAGIAARLATPLIGFLLTPYLLGELGREGFGLYALSIAMVAWLSMLDLGLTPGLRILLARGSARLDAQGIQEAVSSAAAGQLALAAATAAAGVALACAAPLLVDDPLVRSGEAFALIMLLTAGSAVSVGTHFLAGALEAHQLGYVERSTRVLRAVVRALLAVLLLERGWGLAALGWAHVAAAGAGGAALLVGVRTKLPELRLRIAAVRLRALLSTARVGLWLSAGSIAGVLIAGVDRAVAAKVLSLESVAVLALTMALFLTAEGVAGQALDAGRPLLAQALGSADRNEAVRLYRPMCGAAAAVAILSAAVVFAANPTFVAAWAGEGNHGGVLLDAAAAAALALQLWTLPHRAAAAAALDVRRSTSIRLGEAALNLPLSVGLASSFGLPGVVAGTALAAAATSCWMLPRLACRDLGLAPNTSLRQAARFVPAAIMLAAIAVAARAVGESIGGFAGASAAGAVVAIVAVPLLWATALDVPTRNALRRPLAFAS